MKLFALIALSALTIGSASYAKADVISISGSDTYTTTGSPVTGFDISFDPLANIGGTSTGIFSVFTGCYQCVTLTSTLSYSEGTAFTPTELFSIAQNGNAATVTLTSINSVTNDLSVNGNATFVVNGTTYYGTLDFTTQGGGQGVNNVTFSATSTTSPVPEPASLALFGTGLLGAVGAIRRKYNV
jgi:hypothetical protein